MMLLKYTIFYYFPTILNRFIHLVIGYGSILVYYLILEFPDEGLSHF